MVGEYHDIAVVDGEEVAGVGDDFDVGRHPRRATIAGDSFA
jgi:hypothetical protein